MSCKSFQSIIKHSTFDFIKDVYVGAEGTLSLNLSPQIHLQYLVYLF